MINPINSLSFILGKGKEKSINPFKSPYPLNSSSTSVPIYKHDCQSDIFVKSKNINNSNNVKPPFLGGFLLSFTGGKTDIRKLWMQGLLPTVKKGFYGDTLTAKNVTREHLLPASLGGKRSFSNIVLASATKNGARGNSDINLFADKDIVNNYLEQFKDVKLPDFNGKKYIDAVVETLKTLGFNLFSE